MAKINPTRTKALDSHPALRGGQSRLPDALQAKIIRSRLKKQASLSKFAEDAGKKLDELQAQQERAANKRYSISMNQSPIKGAIARGLVGAGLGYAFGGNKGAIRGAALLPAVGELERRLRNRYYKLDGTEKLSMYKLAGDLEGRMARRQLTEICEMAQELLSYIGDEEDMHEWVQNKITTVHDRLSSVHSYVAYEKKNPPMPMQPDMLGMGV